MCVIKSLINVRKSIVSRQTRALTGRGVTPKLQEAYLQNAPIVIFTGLCTIWVVSPYSVMLSGQHMIEFAFLVCELIRPALPRFPITDFIGWNRLLVWTALEQGHRGAIDQGPIPLLPCIAHPAFGTGHWRQPAGTRTVSSFNDS